MLVMGECLNGIQEVSGSIPLVSTIFYKYILCPFIKDYKFFCF